MENKERYLMLECGDGRWRMIVVDTATSLVIRSSIIAEPVEAGWEPEEPHLVEAEFPKEESIPVRHGEDWNPAEL